MPEELMSIKQVADYFGVTTRTVQNYLAAKDENKRLKGFKLGNKWRFETSDLEEFKQKLRTSTTVNVHSGS